MVTAQDQGSNPDVLRERLLEAAATVFAREGYAGTKLMDIVREAGLSTGAVYGRFRSKNELLQEAVVSRSAASSVPEPADQKVADLIARSVMQIGEPLSDVEAMRLEAYVAARREPEVAKALADAQRKWLDAVAPFVPAAFADGTVADDVDPEAVLFFVRVMHLGLLVHRASGQPSPDADAWAALVDRMVASFGVKGDSQ